MNGHVPGIVLERPHNLYCKRDGHLWPCPVVTMTNPAKQKGTAWESTLVQAFREEFGNCERLALNGNNDEGDLWFKHGDRSFVIEAKNERAIDLARYVTEAQVEAENWAKSRKASIPFWAAIVKRRNHRVNKAYVVMTLEEFVRLVKG